MFESYTKILINTQILSKPLIANLHSLPKVSAAKDWSKLRQSIRIILRKCSFKLILH